MPISALYWTNRILYANLDYVENALELSTNTFIAFAQNSMNVPDIWNTTDLFLNLRAHSHSKSSNAYAAL